MDQVKKANILNGDHLISGVNDIYIQDGDDLRLPTEAEMNELRGVKPKRSILVTRSGPQAAKIKTIEGVKRHMKP